MIEVVINHKESGAELGRIEIENVTIGATVFDDVADFSVRIGVNKIHSIGIIQRGIVRFYRRKYNVLALLKQALETLEPEDLELDGPYEERTYHKGNVLDSGGRFH